MRELRIEEILVAKQRECRLASTPEEVEFSLEEIESLQNKVALNVFRMSNTRSLDFKPCATLNDCLEQIKKNDNLYYVLEFCIKKNRVCQPTAYSIFDFLENQEEGEDV